MEISIAIYNIVLKLDLNLDWKRLEGTGNLVFSICFAEVSAFLVLFVY